MPPINGDSSIKLINSIVVEQDMRANMIHECPNGLPVDMNKIIVQYDQDNNSMIEETVGAILNENKYCLHSPNQPTLLEPRMQELFEAIGRLQNRIHSLILDPEYLSWMNRPNPSQDGKKYLLDPRHKFATIVKFLPHITQLSFACERTIDVVENGIYCKDTVLAVITSFQKLESLDLSKRCVMPQHLREILKLPHLKRLKIVGCVPPLLNLIALRASAPHIEIINQEPLPALGSSK